MDGLIPQGVHLISSSAKIGKSWLMLDLALKLAAGEPFWGIETVKCGVLYLSLEDTLARIQSRLMKLTDEAPSNLRFAVTAGTIGNGLDTAIGNYLHTYPDTKLIIIDTLQKIRSQKNNASGGMYAMFDSLAGNDLAVAVKVVVAHTELFDGAELEGVLIVEDELLAVVLGKGCKGYVCCGHNCLLNKLPGTKGYKPFVPSSLDILSDRRPAKFSLYDPLRYGVLSSDDRY